MKNLNPVSQLRWIIFASGLAFATGSFAATNLPDFTKLVTNNTRSVVNISAIHSKASRPGPDRRQGISYGTGFVIEIGGNHYIITNNHVTTDADEVLVRFSDRIELPAKLIGADVLTDVSLLEITDTEGKTLYPVTVGDSENLQVGQWVAAMGSPFSFDYSVTAGIISALGRSLPDETYVPFIQTDVAVNQGNSGGPLFNLEGEVIGINSRIFSRTGTYAGLSFSIPIHIALEVAQQLQEKGSVTRGFLGVTIRDVTRELIKPFGLKKARGALVVEVSKNGAADKADIRNGDIIIEYQGKEIINSGDLPVLVGRTKPGSRETLILLREGKRKTIELTIGSRSGDSDQITQVQKLGIELVDLDSSELSQYGIDNGVGIQSIQADSPAFKAGFQAGDIITHFYQTPVSSSDEFFSLVEQARSRAHVPIRILRNQRVPIYIALQIP